MKHILIVTALTCAFIACKKDDDAPVVIEDEVVESIPSAELYFPLDIGNTWKYHMYEVHAGSSFERYIDEVNVEIIGDTTIRGRKFARFNREAVQLFFVNDLMLSDSNGYMIDPSGKVHFRNVNHYEIFNWDDSDQGNLGIEYLQNVTQHDFPNSDDPNLSLLELKQYAFVDTGNGGEVVFAQAIYFASGIGPVLRHYMYFQPWLQEKSLVELRLVDYQVK